jgi:hypothetical protein
MQQLKRLSYTSGNLKYVGDMDNSPEGLSAGLQVVESTLEYLYAGGYYLEYESDLLCTLRDFPGLREISVQMGLLIGLQDNKRKDELWEKLPTTLEKLTFRGGEDPWSKYNDKSRQDTSQQVMGVVLRNETHFPNARYIYMMSFDDLDLEPLKEICTARNVFLNKW